MSRLGSVDGVLTETTSLRPRHRALAFAPAAVGRRDRVRRVLDGGAQVVGARQDRFSSGDVFDLL